MRHPSGFTLIELMIVLVVTGIIAAFAVPNLLESQKAGNETGAEKALKALLDAEAAFMKADYDGDGRDFAFSLDALHGTTDGAGNRIELIPVSFTSLGTPPNTREGYIYGELGDYNTAGSTDPRGGFAYCAVPVDYGNTGRRSYIVNQAGQIYYKDTGDSTQAAAGALWSALDPLTAGNGWIPLGE